MKDTFVITGLPRSGTAWCSALISLCPNAFCLHEGEIQYRGNALTEYLDERPERFVGDSAPLSKDGRFDHWAVRKVALVRPVDDVIKAVKKAFHGLMTEDAVRGDMDLLQNWINENSPVVILFKDLFTIDTSKLLWDYLLPGEQFPEDKVAALCRTRVEQVIPPKRTILRDAKRI